MTSGELIAAFAIVFMIGMCLSLMKRPTR